MFGLSLAILGVAAGVVIGPLVLWILLSMMYRTVVPTNQVHITQSSKRTTPYGKGEAAGNVYHRWPSWVPRFGITHITMPTSIFDIDLEGYDAYDQDRVPFTVDVKAFFRVEDASVAAQRVESFVELREQLSDILRGAIRTILAKSDIQTIMSERAAFGEHFTMEIKKQMEAWGVSTVKNIEFMDIRDTHDSDVIANIMAMKTSEIEKDSRVEVAGNRREAQEAEIAAQRSVDVKQQEALQKVGEREAEKDKAVGVANEQASQDIKTQKKVTAEKEMDVVRVNDVKMAEIAKDIAVIEAEKQKQETVIIADGVLEQEKKKAEAVRVNGEASADAEKAMQMAPVEAQIALAKEIGGNSGYMEYLMSIEGFAVGEKIGVAKAKALAEGDLKIIANAGSVEGGVTKMMDLFSSGGGTGIASMLEGLSQTDTGKDIITALTERLDGTAKAKTKD